MIRSNDVDSNIKSILQFLAHRQRVHVDKPIYVSRLYRALKAYGLNIDKRSIDALFLDLVRKGYGSTVTNSRGRTDAIRLNKNIKDISLEMLRDNSPLISSKDNVTILFQLSGKRCKAIIPIELAEEFEKSLRI